MIYKAYIDLHKNNKVYNLFDLSTRNKKHIPKDSRGVIGALA